MIFRRVAQKICLTPQIFCFMVCLMTKGNQPLDLVAASAAGVLSAFNRGKRITPYYKDAAMSAAWFSGYDAERDWQEHQLAFPIVTSLNPRSSTNGI